MSFLSYSKATSKPLSRSESAHTLKSPAVAHIQTLVAQWFSKTGQRSRVSRGDQKRAEILWNILASETKYIKQLTTLQKSFYRPIKASHLLSDSQLRILFLNCEEFLWLHTDFKAEIVQVVRDWSLIQELGPPFQILVQKLELYREYAEKYSDMLQLMQLQLANADFQKILKKKQSTGKDLRALLLAPLQVIPRYTLFLKEYLSYSHKKHVDYVDLPPILDLFSGVTDLCKTAQKANDDADKIMFIVSHVQDARLSVFSSESRYITEGELQFVRSDEDQEIVYGYLFNDVIFLTIEDPKISRTVSFKVWNKVFTQNSRNKCIFHSAYRTADIIEVCALGNNTFTLVLAGQHVTFQMSSREKREEWLKNLKSFVAVPTNGRSMTM